MSELVTIQHALYQIEDIFDEDEKHEVSRERAFGYYEEGIRVAWSPDEYDTDDGPSFDESEFICLIITDDWQVMIRQSDIEDLIVEVEKWRERNQ